MCMPFFKKIAACWERYRFTDFVLEYVPVASSYTSGTFVAGIEWDTGKKATSYAATATLSPLLKCAVYQMREMVIPKTRLNALLWYDTEKSESFPFAITWAVLHDAEAIDKAMGVLYVRYTVQFMGTRGE